MKIGRTVQHIAITASLFLLGLSPKCYCQDATDDVAWQHYERIVHNSTLEWLSSQPFLLKVEFQLYDLDGNPAEKGTAEESWTRTDGKVIRIQSPSLVEGEGPEDEAKTYTRESYLVHQALRAISRPFPDPIEKKDFAIDEFQQTVREDRLNCFALEPAGTWKGATPTYCTDVDNRLIAMTGQFFTIWRSDFRKYRDHEAPMDVKLSYEGRPALAMRVIELDALPEESVATDKIKDGSKRSLVPGKVIAGSIVKKKNPDYPKEARKKHIGGSVVIAALISKQGTIAYLDVIASPNVLFSQSARDAVKTWTYKPYLLNGEPVEVDTTITVNYNLNQ